MTLVARYRVALFLAAPLVLAAPVGAGEPAPEVRVFTNADLERLEPIAVSAAPVAEPDPDGWEFVQDFIDRQNEQIASQQDRELERRRLELDAEALRYEAESSYLPYGGYGYGYGAYSGYYPRGDRGRPRHRGGKGASWTGRRHAWAQGSSAIVPIHARPPLSLHDASGPRGGRGGGRGRSARSR